MLLDFTWDRQNAAANLEKHGVSFEEASTACGDSLSITVHDPDHSENEERFVLVGESFRSKLLVVVHSEHRTGPVPVRRFSEQYRFRRLRLGLGCERRGASPAAHGLIDLVLAVGNHRKKERCKL